MDYFKKLITDIELHSVQGIRECFENGIHPNDTFRNEPLIYELISEYTRTSRFKDCVRAFVDHGLKFDDQLLLSVLLNDDISLEIQINNHSEGITKKYSMRGAYTPMHGVTLLHICTEFNHVACAKVLIQHGADVNARAGLDENGFGGQAAIFHAVNQNSNNSFDMLKYLLEQGADLKTNVTGLIWGKGYEWETFIPSVNPISYAMMGLLPQMHRDEKTIAEVVSLLMKHAYGIGYEPGNVPNAYLKK